MKNKILNYHLPLSMYYKRPENLEITGVLSPLIRWHAEGCARRPVRVRGGVLDDQVGYGKTAISLGLIDCAYKEEG